MAAIPSAVEKGESVRIFPDLTHAQVRYVSIVAFISWVLAVYDFTLFGSVLPLISKDFGWTPEVTGLVATGSSYGAVIIALIIGPLIDRIGRKGGLLVCCFGAAASSLASGFASGVVPMILARGLSGFGHSDQVVIGTYANELYQPKRRGALYGLVHSGWPVGVLFGAVTTAILAPYVGWRGVFWVATFPAVVVGVLAFRLKESPVFQRAKYAKRLVASGADLEDVRRFGGAMTDRATRGLVKPLYLQIFEPEVRRQTIVFMLGWLLNWCAVFTFVILGTTIMTKGLSIKFSTSLTILIISNVVEFCGYLVLAYVGDIVGRKLTVVGSWLIAGFLFAGMLYVAHGTIATIAFYGFGLFFMEGAYTALLTYEAESFPPRMRATGAGLAATMGPVGGIIGGIIYTAMLKVGLDVVNAAAISGCLTLVASGVVMMFGRNIKSGEEMLDIRS